jgi:2-haloacid dehalogenase
MKTAILSNSSPPMLQAAIESAGLVGLFDAVLSVEEVGVYKPHPKVYQLAIDRLGVPAPAISFQSSNAWAAYAASAFGIVPVENQIRTYLWCKPVCTEN